MLANVFFFLVLVLIYENNEYYYYCYYDFDGLMLSVTVMLKHKTNEINGTKTLPNY